MATVFRGLVITDIKVFLDLIGLLFVVGLQLKIQAVPPDSACIPLCHRLTRSWPTCGDSLRGRKILAFADSCCKDVAAESLLEDPTLG